MEPKDKQILHKKFGLALLKIINERKEVANANKEKGIKDHQLVSSLRKLAAASGIDFGTIQKISQGHQGLEFFTFMDILDTLELDIVEFGEYFSAIAAENIPEYKKQSGKAKKPKKKE